MTCRTAVEASDPALGTGRPVTIIILVWQWDLATVGARPQWSTVTITETVHRDRDRHYKRKRRRRKKKEQKINDWNGAERVTVTFVLVFSDLVIFKEVKAC